MCSSLAPGIKESELESRKKNASTVGLFTVSWTLQLLHLKTLLEKKNYRVRRTMSRPKSCWSPFFPTQYFRIWMDLKKGLLYLKIGHWVAAVMDWMRNMSRLTELSICFLVDNAVWEGYETLRRWNLIKENTSLGVDFEITVAQSHFLFSLLPVCPGNTVCFLKAKLVSHLCCHYCTSLEL